MNYLCEALLFVSLAFCISMPVPSHFDDGPVGQGISVRGAFWITPRFHSLKEIESAGLNVETDADLSCYNAEEEPSLPDCPSFVENMYDPNRVPQWISNVTCLSETSLLAEESPVTQCEPVTVEVAVLKKTSSLIGQEIFMQAWETVNVACIRTVPASDISSLPGHWISFEKHR
ncbi:hypothetical protein NPIL_227361 [Nephila pilipes]|uniref:Uncharacterized protein n=1 Tax=Nephila pilipes TaxID=299642 RepID=A0A8X6TW65_NEPPI|nr:hypothetical protein NPIL_227361 [Nephila pilipes]